MKVPVISAPREILWSWTTTYMEVPPCRIEPTRCIFLKMMRTQLSKFLAFATLITVAALLFGQPAPKPEENGGVDTSAQNRDAGATNVAPPSDAIVLFDGKSLDEWVSAQDKSPAQWTVADGVMTVKKASGVGNIETMRTLKNYQLHIEWRFQRISPAAVRSAATAACFLPPLGRMGDESCSFWIRTTTRPTSTAKQAASTSRAFLW